MLLEPDFMSKKVVLVFTNEGDKISFKNDNLTIIGKDGKVKLQYSCYKIFAVFIIGGFSITTGIIDRAKKFGISIVLFSNSFRVYQTISSPMEGNTLLRKKQYHNDRIEQIGKAIVINKIENQNHTISKIRNKSEYIQEGAKLLDKCVNQLADTSLSMPSIMGIEGIASKVYFNRIFENLQWYGRQPRVKRDQINVLLDIGYTVLFNYIEAVVNIYGFDIYLGCLHREFYKRKSLICDLVEPFRPIIDYNIRKMYALKQIDDLSFVNYNGVYAMKWNESSKYVKIVLGVIHDYRQDVFRFVQSYYRWFMKDKDMICFPKARLVKNDTH